MKLHLPKRILTALLAAFSAISLSTGSAAWGAAETIEASVTWTSDEDNENHKYARGEYLTVQGDGVTLTIDGETVTGEATLSLKNKANVIITGDSDVTISRLVTHDSNSGGTSESVTLNGGVLNITDSDTGSGNFWTAVLIGHWGDSPSTSLNVNGGQLNVLNGTVQLGFSSAGNMVVTGGTANIKKLNVNKGSLTLSGGRLNIGSGGLVGGANQTATLTGGTLGALDNWTLSGVTTTIGTIKIDTDKWDAATGTAAAGANIGMNISLLGNITAAEGGMAITLAGSGTLTIDHTLSGVVTLAEDSTAKILINTNNIDSFNRAKVGEFGDTGASGFWIGYQIYGAGSNAAVYSTTDTNTQLDLINGVYGVTSTEFDVNDSVVYNAAQMSAATQFNVFSSGSFDVRLDSTVKANIANKGEVLIGGTSQLAKVNNSENGAVYLLGEDGKKLLKFYGNFNGGTLSSSVDGNTVTSSTGGNFAGNITVLNGTTLKAQSSTNINAWECFGSNTLNRVIQVEGNATLDVNGVSNYYKVELQKGATLANDAVNDHTGNNNVTSHKQLPQIILSGNAEIRAISNFGMVGGSYDNTTLTLNSHTLTKTGSGVFIATNTTITEGTVQIDAGTFHSYTTSTGSTSRNANLTAASFVVNQNGTFKVTGDNETIKNLTINGGSLETDAKTVTVSGSTVLNGGNLAGNLTASNILFSSAMTQTSGTLTLSSSVKIDESMLASASGITLVDASGTAGASGFLAAGATGTLLTSTAGSVVLSEGLTTTLAGASTQLQFADGVLAYTTTTRGYTFIVNEDLPYNATTMAGATGFYIADGKTLSTIDSSAGNPILSGSGIYNLGAVSGTSVPSLNATLGENWTGAVAVTTGNASFNLTQFNSNYANANSKLKFTDFKGYIQDTYTVSHNLILENGDLGYGIRLMNGSSSASPIITFSGSIEGTGNLLYSWPNGNPGTNATIEFSGDTSLWQGMVIRKILNNSDTTEANGGKPLYVNFTSGGSVFSSEGNGGVSDAQNRDMVHVLIDASDNKKTFFNGTLENINSLTVKTDTQFNKNVRAKSIIADNATVNLADGIALTLGANTNSSIYSLQGSNATMNLSGGTLTLGNGSVSSMHSVGTIVASTQTTLILNEGATLNAYIKSGSGSISLQGSGVLNLGNASTTYNTSSSDNQSVNGNSSFAITDNWSGTVRIQNAIHQTNKLGLNLNNISNATSAVELINVNGWFTNTMKGTLILTADDAGNAAWTISNGGSKADVVDANMATFDGAICGDGKMLFIWAPSSSTGVPYTGFTFNGDISKWTGMFEMSSNTSLATFNLTLGGSANIINATIGNSSTNKAKLHLTVDTSEAAIFSQSVSATNITLNQDATFSGKVTANMLSVATGKSVTLNGGTAETQMIHSIGSFNGTVSNLKLGDYTTLSFANGTETSQKVNTVGSLTTSTSAGISLGDYATLKITEVPAALKSSYSEGNNDASSSVSLAITGGTGSVLDLAMSATDDWQKNNTVTLTQGENSGLTVRISSGYLANSVFAANNNVYTTTNLGGSALSMAKDTMLVLRKGNSAENFGAGDITLEGTTNLRVYGSVSKDTSLTNNISGDTLNITNGTEEGSDGGITLTGNLNLTKLSNQAREEVVLSGESMQFGTLEVKSSNGSTTTINGNATADSVSVQQGKLSVTADGALNLGDTATITKSEVGNAASMEKVQLSEEGISSADETGDTKGTVSDAKVTLAALAEGTSFSIEDVTLSNVNIEAANASDRVNLSNVGESTVQLTKGEFHMLDKPQAGTGGTAINLVEGGPTGLDFSTSLLNGMTLGADASMVVDLGDLSGFAGMDSGKPTFSITLEGFSLRDYTGTGENKGLYFASDSWLGQLLVAQGASQYVKGDSLEAGAQATAGSGSGVSVSYNSTAVGTGTVIIISGLQVPEPTTTSLSLLALSALAMRRRRK